jgi:DNA-binding response OmpR family regulator
MSHILIVDDDSDIKNLMEFFLKKKGYEVTTASDGNKALEVLESVTPDLIIIDMLMPGMDGVRTIEEMNKSAQNREIPVIMVSGARDEMDLMKGLLQRSIQYIEKPFSHDKLLTIIEQMLQEKKGEANE